MCHCTILNEYGQTSDSRKSHSTLRQGHFPWFLKVSRLDTPSDLIGRQYTLILSNNQQISNKQGSTWISHSMILVL